jgi:hypothetical protein
VPPIEFDAVFTAIQIPEGQNRFKADVSLREMACDGIERPLSAPYLKTLWRGRDTPSVWVMQPVEALAEKILGWCAHNMAKHYVDAAWIVAANEDSESGVKFKYPKLREALGDKLTLMSALQPSYYRELPSVDAVVGRLNRPPIIDAAQWDQLVFLKDYAPDRDRTVAVVQKTLVPKLRRAAPR